MRLSQIFRIKWGVFIRIYIRNLNLGGPLLMGQSLVVWMISIGFH